MANWSERELEDWLWEHPEALHAVGPRLRWLGRQVTLPNGSIIDLLGMQCGEKPSLTVVELKACEADGRALAQLLSYMYLLSQTCVANAEDYLVGSGCVWQDLFEPETPVGHLMDVRGMLVAPCFTERTVLASEHSSVTCWAIEQTFRTSYVSMMFFPEDKKCSERLHTALVNVVSAIPHTDAGEGVG